MGLFRKRAPRPVEPTPDAVAALREHVEAWVRAGFTPYDEVVADAIDLGGDDGVPADLARAIVDECWDRVVAEQATWPERTDSDRLDAAFAALEAQGIVARMSFSCCGSCAPGEIAAEVGGPGIKRGYVYFHSQDAETIAEGSVFLGYGSLQGHRKGVRYDKAGFEQASREVAQAAVDALRAEGLTVEWNGFLRTRVLVAGLDWKRRLPSRLA